MKNGKGSEGSHSNGSTSPESPRPGGLSDAEQILHAYNHATRLCYVEGMRKVLKTLAPYVGRMEGHSKDILWQGLDKIEKEIAETEAAIQVALVTPKAP